MHLHSVAGQEAVDCGKRRTVQRKVNVRELNVKARSNAVTLSKMPRFLPPSHSSHSRAQRRVRPPRQKPRGLLACADPDDPKWRL